MNKKHIALITGAFIVFGALLYATKKDIGAKQYEKYRKRYVELVNKFAKEKTLADKEIQEIKKIWVYRPKKYRIDLARQLQDLIAGKTILVEKEETKDEKAPEMKPVEFETTEEEIFFIVFNKTMDDFLTDLQIITPKKPAYKRKLKEIVTNIMAGRKQYIGPDTGKIIMEKKKQEKTKKKALTGTEIKAIVTKMYPADKKAKLSKMARNQLANEIVEKYLEKDLKDKAKQMAYRKKLLEALKPKAQHATKGYNIEKIEFLQTVKPLDKEKAIKKLNELRKNIENQLTKLKQAHPVTEGLVSAGRRKMSKQEQQIKKELEKLRQAYLVTVGPEEEAKKGEITIPKEKIEKEQKELKTLREEYLKALKEAPLGEPAKFDKAKLERLTKLTKKYIHFK